MREGEAPMDIFNIMWTAGHGPAQDWALGDVGFRAGINRMVWFPSGNGGGSAVWTGPLRSDPLHAEFDLLAVARMWHLVWPDTFHLVRWDKGAEHDACVVADCETRTMWETSTLVDWLSLSDGELSDAMYGRMHEK